MRGQKSHLARAGEGRAGPGSLPAKGGLGPSCSWKGCLVPTWSQRDGGARGLRARRRSHASAPPQPSGLSPADACQPACTGCPDQRRARWAGARRARTHARGQKRAGAHGQTGGLAQGAGPIHTLWSQNRKARRMGPADPISLAVERRLWGTWGAERREAPRKRVVFMNRRVTGEEHEGSPPLAQTLR